MEKPRPVDLKAVLDLAASLMDITDISTPLTLEQRAVVEKMALVSIADPACASKRAAAITLRLLAEGKKVRVLYARIRDAIPCAQPCPCSLCAAIDALGTALG